VTFDLRNGGGLAVCQSGHVCVATGQTAGLNVRLSDDFYVTDNVNPILMPTHRERHLTAVPYVGCSMSLDMYSVIPKFFTQKFSQTAENF